MLLYFVKIKWRIIPATIEYEPIYQNPSAYFQIMILPWITLALLYAAFYSRLTRNQMLETLGEDYIRTARAKGLTERVVILRHAFRAGLTPIVTSAGLDLAGILGGAIITESIFSLPGLGRLSVNAVVDTDLPVITGTVLVAAVFVIIANLIVDLLYAVIDPRVRLDMTRSHCPILPVDATSASSSPRRTASCRRWTASPSPREGQDAGDRGRVRLGQERDQPGDHGPAQPQGRARSSARSGSTARSSSHASEQRLRAVAASEMAMIFQDPLSSLHPYYRIGKQLVEAILVHQDDQQGARHASTPSSMLDRVGIPNAGARIDDYPHQLSGGMRQRVMIAMALINDPELLIADEPTTALDVTVQAQILELLNDLQREFGTAIIIITHDLGVVADVADEVAVMYGGRIVEHGTVRRHLLQPRDAVHAGPARLDPAHGPPAASRLDPIPGQPPSLINLPKGCVFRPRCTYHELVPDDRCDTERPELLPTAPGHEVRCHLTPSAAQGIAAERLGHARPGRPVTATDRRRASRHASAARPAARRPGCRSTSRSRRASLKRARRRRQGGRRHQPRRLRRRDPRPGR